MTSCPEAKPFSVSNNGEISILSSTPNNFENKELSLLLKT